MKIIGSGMLCLFLLFTAHHATNVNMTIDRSFTIDSLEW